MIKNTGIILTCCLLLSGCLFKPVALPQTHTYTLNASSTKQFSRFPNLVSIQVLQPTASSYYISEKMYYQLTPHHLQAYNQNRWIAAPNQMLLPLIMQSLINSNYYHAVISALTNSNTQYQLATRLIDFYQDFTTKPSQFMIAIQAILINNKTHQIIVSQVFKASVPSSSNNAYGGVLAANIAIQQILIKMVQFCIGNSG